MQFNNSTKVNNSFVSYFITPKILYKLNGTQDTVTLLNMVRYLYTQGYDIRANTIVERNFPGDYADKLPVLVLQDNRVLKTLSEIVHYYENLTKISDLANRSNSFDRLNPDFRITLPYTHKNLKYPNLNDLNS